MWSQVEGEKLPQEPDGRTVFMGGWNYVMQLAFSRNTMLAHTLWDTHIEYVPHTCLVSYPHFRCHVCHAWPGLSWDLDSEGLKAFAGQVGEAWPSENQCVCAHRPCLHQINPFPSCTCR